MARISELHYSNAYASNSGVGEFLEVSLGANQDPADFTVSFYQSTGLVGLEVTLDDPRIQVSVDPENGEVVYVLQDGPFDLALTDPDGGGATNYEAYALTQTGTPPAMVLDFYDIGGGTQNILALDGAAAGAVSDNLAVLVSPGATTTSLQFNQPDPGTLVYETVSPGDTGLACFLAGSMIDTPDGPRAIETLGPGDLVLTRDRGAQPVRWSGSRTVDGTGAFAPILIRAGALGAWEDVRVSPNHRILVEGWQAELLFGEAEIMVPAKALINDVSILRAPCCVARYVHLLFDQHEIVSTSGLDSESLFPGAALVDTVGPGPAEEIFALFPQLRSDLGAYGPASRPVARPAQGRLLRGV